MQKELIKKVGFIDFETRLFQNLQKRMPVSVNLYCPPKHDTRCLRRACYQFIWQSFKNKNQKTCTFVDRFRENGGKCHTFSMQFASDRYLYAPDFFIQKILQGSFLDRFVVVRLLIQIQHPKVKNRCDMKKSFLHANALIFDQQNKIIYRIDPLGEQAYQKNVNLRFQDQFLNESLQSFTKWLGYGAFINWIQKGPQYFQEEEPMFQEIYKAKGIGFCSAWVCVLIECFFGKRTVPKHNMTQFIEHYSSSLL